jgi:hypothetical protein
LFFVQGLSINEAAKLNNYFHFREAQLLKEKPLLYLANLDRAIDFLDPIDEDQPKSRPLVLAILTIRNQIFLL